MQILLLTDGEVFNTQEVIDLVKKNASNTRYENILMLLTKGLVIHINTNQHGNSIALLLQSTGQDSTVDYKRNYNSKSPFSEQDHMTKTNVASETRRQAIKK